MTGADFRQASASMSGSRGNRIPAFQDCWTKSQVFILHRAPTLRHYRPASVPRGWWRRDLAWHDGSKVQARIIMWEGGDPWHPYNIRSWSPSLLTGCGKSPETRKFSSSCHTSRAKGALLYQLWILASSGDILPRPRLPSQWEEPFVRCEQLDEMMTCTINLPRPVRVSTYSTKHQTA